ncbi:MAG TPA: hypothetical protein VJ850_09695 [Candidatus Limnocylindrales bacterium]|nr:hypothetical protein [Candidatus Limnocylindrales bacterium]
MAIDIRPVHARLERARKHAAEVDAILEAYVSGPPYRIVTREGSRDDTIVERAILVERPPIKAAMAVSDAIHQARASLDNLVNALRVGGPAPGITFPIRADKTEWWKLAKDALEGVPEPIVRTIAAMQPFSSDAFRWAGDELVALHDLARFDRHRVPPLHAAVVQPGPVFTDGGDAVVEFRMHDGPDGQWAETEYVVGRAHSVRFEVEVRFGADAGAASAGLDVVDWTRRLVDVAYHVARLVLQTPAA